MILSKADSASTPATQYRTYFLTLQETGRMIVDFHTHVFPPEIIARRDEFASRDLWLGELYGNPKAKMATVDDLLASMEANQIDAAVTFPFGWRDSGLAHECNSYIIQAMSDHPGRIIGLASVQPLAGRGAIAELE